jgi:uncharacterized protein
MKIILDTNVFISGIFFTGPPSQILKAWENNNFQIVISKNILAEYQRVAESLSSKFPSININPVIELLTVHCEFVDTLGINISVCEDQDDDKFIECAVASKCKTIISGDKHLLKLTGYKGIDVLKPKQFVDSYL